tara:strand:- start:205 stop:480 length:276 start_codon:yes stop_codon:yes gene_type:complete
MSDVTHEVGNLRLSVCRMKEGGDHTQSTKESFHLSLPTTWPLEHSRKQKSSFFFGSGELFYHSWGGGITGGSESLVGMTLALAITVPTNKT